MEYGQFKELNEEGAERLVDAIVRTAVRDWQSAKRILAKYPESYIADARRTECEKFFLSDYFYFLTGLNGKLVLDKLEEGFNAS